MSSSPSKIVWTPYGSIKNISKPSSSVTGSLHKFDITVGRDIHQTLVIDAGLHRGLPEVEANNGKIDFECDQLDAMILTHAHADHEGQIPLLVKKGFEGPIHLTHQTRDIYPITMQDDLNNATRTLKKIREMRNRFGKSWKEAIMMYHTEGQLTKTYQKLLKEFPHITKTADIAAILDEKFGSHQALYDQDDLDHSILQLMGHDYDQKFLPFVGVESIQARLFDAGHIFGSAMVLIGIQKKSGGKIFNILHTGDLGRYTNRLSGQHPTLSGVKKQIDLLLIEATYGGKNHPDIRVELEKEYLAIRETFRKGGTVVEPHFTLERIHQSALQKLEAIGQGILPKDTKIIIDTKLGHHIAKVMANYDDEYRNILKSPHIQRLEEKKDAELLLKKHPQHHVFLMSGGMMEGGTIRKLLPYFDKQNKDIEQKYHHIAKNGLIIITGYTTEHTRGYQVRTDPERYNTLSLNYSGHIDHNGIVDFILNRDGRSNIALRNNAKIALIHGEIGGMYKIKDDLVACGIKENNIIIPTTAGESFTFPIV